MAAALATPHRLKRNRRRLRRRTSGRSVYAYVGGNPLRWTDPSGLYADICRDGNNIYVDFPLQFSGDAASADNIDAVASAINTAWSGRKGAYNVTMNARAVGTAPHPNNNITLAPGIFRSDARTWHVPGGWGSQTWVHEAGHVLLSYEYGSGGHDNLYGSVMTGTGSLNGTIVLPQHISAMLNNPQNDVREAGPCGCP